MSAALAAAAQTPPAYEHNQGHVLIALQNAFYQALHARLEGGANQHGHRRHKDAPVRRGVLDGQWLPRPGGDLACRFVAWLPHGRGKGRTTTEAVRRLQAGEPWYRAGDNSSGSAPAMRAAPIGLLCWNDPGQLCAEAVLSALPTHRQPAGVAGAAALAAATAWQLTCETGEWEAHEFIAAVQAAIDGVEPGPQAKWRDPSVKTTLHDRIGLIPDLLAREPDEVFARIGGIA